jgi:3-deoxy-D-arabino-heptulosonate 7-phosphate (DAHP) synthase class II
MESSTLVERLINKIIFQNICSRKLLYVQNKILWHIDPLLGNDHETNNKTMAVDKQWPVQQ